MRIKKNLSLLLVGIIGTFLLAACGGEEGFADDEKLQVVGDFTIMSDIAEEVGGDRVEVYNVIPEGEEPHEWDPSPDDTKKTADADAFFYFGWNLEGLDSDSENWVYKMLNSADKDKDDDDVFALSDGIEQLELSTEDFEGTPNPHGFNTPKNGIQMVENARDAYISIDPDHEDDYRENADELISNLEDLDQEYEERIGDIDKEDRVFVSEERSFQYIADTYGLEEGWIWERDSDEVGEGTPQQVKDTISFVEEHEPNSLFVEYTSDEKHMETVSNETGVPIEEKKLYSEELGETDNFVDYLKHNLDAIVDGLTREN